MPGIVVKPRARIFHGHDWVYASEIRKLFGEPKPGDVISLKPDGIHSVEAADGKPSRGIHVYLAKLTQIERSLFDWDSGEPRPFTDDNYYAMKRIGP